MLNWLRRMLRPMDTAARTEKRRADNRDSWNNQWSRSDYSPPWLGRGVSKEVIEAVEQEWFAPGGAAIDIGCGQGEVCGYLAEQGFHVLGVDIAESAIKRCREQYGHLKHASFEVRDICAASPGGGPFAVVVDRGCLHQIPREDHNAYRKNLLAITTPGARVLLFVKAFRDGVPIGDEAERNSKTAYYSAALGDRFKLLRTEMTYLDARCGADPKTALGGLVYWYERV